MLFTIGNLDVRADLRSRQPWTHFRIHRTEYSRHLVWGKLSILVENWALEVHPICGQCGSGEVGEVGSGDEGWTVCQSCRSVEGGYEYVNLRKYEES